MRLIVLILSLITFFVSNILCQQNWETYSSGININDMVLDGEYVWIASEGGLIKMHKESGEKEIFRTSNSDLRANHIMQLERDSEGAIWVGCYGPLLGKLQNNQWTWYDLEEVSIGLEIDNLICLENGDVWFELGNIAYQGQVYRLRDDEFESFVFNVATHTARKFVIQSDSIAWIRNGFSTYNKLIRFDIQNQSTIDALNFQNSPFNDSNAINDIILDSNNDLIVCTTKRVYRYKDESWIEISDFSADYKQVLLGVDGVLYFRGNKGTIANYFYRYNGVDFEEILIGTSTLPNISSSYQMHLIDENGHVWCDLGKTLPTEDNIAKLDFSKWTTYDSNIDILSTSSFKKVIFDCNDRAWTIPQNEGILSDINNRLLYYFEDNIWNSILLYGNIRWASSDIAFDKTSCSVYISNLKTSGQYIPSLLKINETDIDSLFLETESIQHIEIDKNGKVFLYSRDHGLGQLINDTVMWVPNTNWDIFNYVSKLETNDLGDIFLSSREFGLVKYDGVDLTFLSVDSDLDIIPGPLYIDNEGLVWMRTEEGIAMYDGFNWTSFDANLPNGIYSNMKQDVYGNYWIVGPEGLYYWNKISSQVYTNENSGFSLNGFRDLNINDKNQLWITQDFALNVLTQNNNNLVNRATGFVFFDTNQNGVWDKFAEFPVGGQKIETHDGRWSITNHNGEYRHYFEQAGDYNLSINLEAPWFNTTINDTLVSIASSSVGPNFGIFRPDQDKVVDIDLTTSQMICSRPGKHWIQVSNEFLDTLSGAKLSLSFKDNLEILNFSSTNAIINDTSIYVDLPDIEPYGKKMYHFDIKAPGVEFLDELIKLSATIEHDKKITNTTTTNELLCSYDPNDKVGSSVGLTMDEFSLIKDEIEFTIRFQNEGNFKAFDILITDTLSSYLDPRSMKFISSSHQCFTTMGQNGELTFSFPDINLPPKSEDEPGSQGYVKFSIKCYQDINDFTEIQNTANIYFDFNPAIVTNTTSNTLLTDFSLLSTEEDTAKKSYLYPNPSSGKFTLNSPFNGHYQVYDVVGRLIDQNRLYGKPVQIDLIDNVGIFFLVVTDLNNTIQYRSRVIVN